MEVVRVEGGFKGLAILVLLFILINVVAVVQGRLHTHNMLQIHAPLNACAYMVLLVSLIVSAPALAVISINFLKENMLRDGQY